MTRIDADIAILGAGFGGSLMAILLRRIGLRPALIDRAAHPRFAIGESSTPTADLILRELAARYDLPRIEPLARFGPWQRTYPHLPCGLKRGFSYFKHQPERPFAACPDHSNELLVGASADDATSDTHWYRPDFDQFLAEEAQREGAEYFDRTDVTRIQSAGGGWRIDAMRQQAPMTIDADFIIDASGDGSALARQLEISTDPGSLRTRSRVIFAHFTDVRPWHDLLADLGGHLADHPFRCDDAALHHILDHGWMWVLQFNNGITSAGFSLDCDAWPLDQTKSPDREWAEIMARYPALARQFAEARIVAPAGGLRRTGRLQRIAHQAAGPGWAMLPTTAGIIDALHSTGNAHNLSGMQRLIGILERHWKRPGLDAALAAYDRDVRNEIDQIDQLVHGCYLAFHRFELLTAYAAWYFVRAEASELRRRAGEAEGDLFLQTQDPRFRSGMQDSYMRLKSLAAAPRLLDENVARFRDEVVKAISPWNRCGFCDVGKRNMHPFPVSACSVQESGVSDWRDEQRDREP
jgi:tetracycline 7-halogenase / FADH2 O2-dependent halogenase